MFSLMTLLIRNNHLSDRVVPLVPSCGVVRGG